MTACVCVIVALVSATARAIPKSITLISPRGPIMTFAGLMSRWTIPMRWLYARASRTPSVMWAASAGSSIDRSLSSSRRVCPSTYSITMYGIDTRAPPDSTMWSSPESYTATMEAWLSPAADWASRRNRVRKRGHGQGPCAAS